MNSRTKIIFSFLFLLSFCSFQTQAQVITYLPVFPTADDSISIFFDATQGSAGLKDTNNVFIHCGAVLQGPNSTTWTNVPFNWGTNNPLARCTKIGSNLWRFKLKPRTLFNLSQAATLYRIGIVFRNTNGSATGKTEFEGDIFMPIYQPGQQAIQILNPASKAATVNIGDTITFKGASSFASTLKFTLNGTTLAEATNATTLNYPFVATAAGNFKYRFMAGNNLTDSILISVRPAVEVLELPAGLEDGITYNNENSVTLVLRAPGKKFIYVIGDFNNWEINNNYYMKKTPDGLKWWIRIDNLTANQEYAFQYLVDGKVRVGDPYTKIILDPNDDSFIPAETYPNRKPYPSGKTTGDVSVLRTNETPYVWQTTNYQRPAKTDLVVYELLVRDFIEKRNFKTLKDSLPYFKKLGINCFELMPVMEFEGNLSWGYNPSFHHALDKFYGTRNDFKAFVDACHQNGIAVVLDIALNHGFSECPLVKLYYNNSTGRVTADNPWVNVTARHPYNVGFDFNHESIHTKYYTKRIIKNWLEEYKVDGFRWDLSKGFTQVNSCTTPNCDSGPEVGNWGNRDASRIAIWKDYYDYQQTVAPGSYCILEHFANNSEETELANYGCMFWGNMVFNYNEGTMGYFGNSDVSWGYHRNRGWNQPNLLSYMESHDEERLMYKNFIYGSNTTPGYNLRDTTLALQRMKLAATFFFTIPGPKMIWQFGELGYGYSINFPCTAPCTNGANRTGQKPIRWDYVKDLRRKSLFETYSALIKLRTREPAFETVLTPSTDLSIGGVQMKRISINGADMKVNVLGNFGTTQSTLTNSRFPQIGKWYEYFSGDSIEISDVNTPITLVQGEYRLYTTKKFPKPSITIVSVDEKLYAGKSLSNLIVYPNPSSDAITFAFETSNSTMATLEICDVNGKVVSSVSSPLNPGTENEIIWRRNGLKQGIYMYRLMAGNKLQTGKFTLL